MKKLHATILFSFIFMVASFAQSKQELKWQQTIDGLEKAEFIQSFTKAKESIEKQMTEFHRHKASLKAADVEEVKKGYEASVINFDKLLDDLKKDFLSKDTRKIMAQSPDRFTKYYNAELEESVRFYNNQCLSKADALVNASEGAFGLAEIQFLIGLGKEIYSLIEKNQERMAKMSSAYFEDHFVRKLRLKKWEQY